MIPRPAYIEKIRPFIDAPFVKILSGVRRSGKSTIMKMIMGELQKSGTAEDRILFLDFDSVQNEGIKTPGHLYDAVKRRFTPNGKLYLFLDEIQELSLWEKAVIIPPFLRIL